MKSYNFMKNTKLPLAVAAIIVVVGIVSFFVFGLNLDIDFAGGNEISVSLGKAVDSEVEKNVRSLVGEVIGDDKISSIAKSGADAEVIIIRTAKLDNDTISKVFEKIKSGYDLDAEAADSIESVGSTVSGSTKKTTFLSCTIAIALILIYVSIRFQFTSGLASIVCLAFNIFTMITFYSLFQIPVNSNLIAACLTILGYSINSTIVIFDRIRENLQKRSKNQVNMAETFNECANEGIRSTLTRSLNTTITTLLTIGMIYILGVESIKDFALPIIIGILAGVFSSIFIGGPLWATFNRVFHSSYKFKGKDSSKNSKIGKAQV